MPKTWEWNMARIKIVATYPSPQATRIQHNGYRYAYHDIGTVEVYFELDAAEAHLLPKPEQSVRVCKELQLALHEHMGAARYSYDGTMLVASYRYTELKEKPFDTTDPHTAAAIALKQLNAALRWLAVRAS
jgi:hypothetical protein